MNGLNSYLMLLIFVINTIVFQGELPTRGQEPHTRELPEGRLGEVIRSFGSEQTFNLVASKG